MSDRELRLQLGHRLKVAAESSIKNHPEDLIEDRWQLVADTIEVMIDRATLEARVSLQQLGPTGKAGCASFNHRSQGFCRNCGFHRNEH